MGVVRHPIVSSTSVLPRCGDFRRGGDAVHKIEWQENRARRRSETSPSCSLRRNVPVHRAAAAIRLASQRAHQASAPPGQDTLCGLSHTLAEVRTELTSLRELLAQLQY